MAAYMCTLGCSILRGENILLTKVNITAQEELKFNYWCTIICTGFEIVGALKSMQLFHYLRSSSKFEKRGKEKESVKWGNKLYVHETVVSKPSSIGGGDKHGKWQGFPI